MTRAWPTARVHDSHLVKNHRRLFVVASKVDQRARPGYCVVKPRLSGQEKKLSQNCSFRSISRAANHFARSLPTIVVDNTHGYSR
jgi:hypothetical protein